MNPEHPPLVKLLSGAAALALRPTVPTSDPSWEARDEWQFGRAFLYQNQVSPDTLLLAGRMPTMLAFGGLLVLLFVILRRHVSPAAGLFGLAFASFDPNFLAFSRYVMTDVMFTLGFVASLYTFWRYLTHPARLRLVLFGLVLGLTLATKFSGLLLIPILFILGLLWRLANRRAGRPLRRVVWDGVAVVGVVFLTVWLTYGFQAPRVLDDNRVRLLYDERQNVFAFYGLTDRQPFRTFLTLTEAGTGRERFIRTVLERVPVPAYPFFRGVSFVWFHNLLGHPYNYLFGETNPAGWPHYFPVVLLLKTPLPLLLLVVAGLGVAIRRFRRHAPSVRSAFLWLPPLLFLAFTIPSHYNIGVHHVLPVSLAFLVAAGFLASRSRGWLVVSLLTLVFTAVGTLRVAPSYLAYANELAGGPTGLPRFLLGGNLDLGQDLKRLTQFLQRRGVDELPIAYHGQGVPEAYGLKSLPLPTDDDLRSGAIPPTGLAAISVTKLYSDGRRYTWLKTREPISRIGYTIYLYDLRP